MRKPRPDGVERLLIAALVAATVLLFLVQGLALFG